MNVLDATVMSYRPLSAAIIGLYSAGVRAALVSGRPGIGKTAMAQPIAEGASLKHIFQLKLAHHDVPDVAGIPVPNHENKRTYFYPSGDMLPDSDLKGGCLFVLDEIGDCNISQQNLACQLVFENRLHHWRAPERTFYLLTSNRVSDRSGANRIVTKLGNRVAFFTLEPTVQELFDYGVVNGWNPILLAFLKQHGNERINPNNEGPTFFNSFDPNDPAQIVTPVFASSRTYEMASDYMNWTERANNAPDDAMVMSTLAGVLSTPVAAKLAAYRKVAHEMPDPDLILKNPKGVPMPKKQEVMWSLTLTLVSKLDKKTFDNAYLWMGQAAAEYLALFARIAFDTKVKELAGPSFNKMLADPRLKQMFTSK